MSEKTLPEQARSLANFIEENNYKEWPEDWEISLILNVLAAEIESESKAADELQGECNNWHYQYQRMCEHAKRLGAERDELIKKWRNTANEYIKYRDSHDSENEKYLRNKAWDLNARADELERVFKDIGDVT